VSVGTSVKQVVRFDPFELIPVFSVRAREINSGWLFIPGLLVACVIVVVTAAEGTLGSFRDFQPARDAQYAFGGTVRYTEPNFTLVRDITSWVLFLVIAAGVVLIHRQWQYISAALPELRKEGIVVPARLARSNAFSRLLRVDRLADGCADYQALDRLDQKMGKVRGRTKALLVIGVLVGGLMLATLVANGLSQGVFRVLVPTDMSVDERQQWLTMARESWWAGPNHPAGFLLYGAILWFAMCLILACNVIGLVTVYMAVALYFVAELRADWYNRDGRYGWTPVTSVYRTVYYCLVLLGTGISFVVALLGPQLAVSMTALIALYLLMIPIWTLIPWLLFRRVERRARRRRLDDLMKDVGDIDKNDLDTVQSLVAEIARCRDARINPMRLGRVPLGAFASVVLLPIVLTTLQIYAQVGLGGR
jgi:hypothetical protein